jgi:hypothetical protein
LLQIAFEASNARWGIGKNKTKKEDTKIIETPKGSTTPSGVKSMEFYCLAFSFADLLFLLRLPNKKSKGDAAMMRRQKTRIRING